MRESIVDVFVLGVGVDSARQKRRRGCVLGSAGSTTELACQTGNGRTNERGYLRRVGTGCTVTACNRAERHTGCCMS